MTAGQVEKNLLLFLDPLGEMEEEEWRFVQWQRRADRTLLPARVGAQEKTVFCFDRRSFVDYILFPWFTRLSGGGRITRKVLHVKDGFLSCFFDADNSAGYSAYAANHVPPPATIRQRLIAWLPLSLRAEKRFVVIESLDREKGRRHLCTNELLEQQDFMFYSNAAGKIVLAAAETLRTGKGLIVKTTANPAYEGIMQREFTTMLRIAATGGNVACLPAVGGCIKLRNKVYFTEEYVKGHSLLEVLRRLSLSDDTDGVCLFLDRLDSWFEDYLSRFAGKSQPLASSYRHLFSSFSDLYGTEGVTAGLVAFAEGFLGDSGKDDPEVAAITAHNDLWPGNFVVREESLIAVDWERASENRAPVYDYYWMMISAALVYIGCRVDSSRFSDTFPRFCAGDNSVSRHGLEKLESFLERRGFDKKLHRNFMLLFLMELSVQGYVALGRQSELDRMAFAELVTYYREVK